MIDGTWSEFRSSLHCLQVCFMGIGYTIGSTTYFILTFVLSRNSAGISIFIAFQSGEAQGKSFLNMMIVDYSLPKVQIYLGVLWCHEWLLIFVIFFHFGQKFCVSLEQHYQFKITVDPKGMLSVPDVLVGFWDPWTVRCLCKHVPQLVNHDAQS